MRIFERKSVTAVKEEKFESYTYAMKPDRVEGYVDGISAVKQAVGKILRTERYEYPIYGFSYGVEFGKLAGKEQPYVRAELKRMVTEALTQDARIKGVKDFTFTFAGDVCQCSFTVESNYGNFPGNMEVGV